MDKFTTDIKLDNYLEEDMNTSEIQRAQQGNLQTKVWDIANDLRGNMEASEFKNYILGLIFYRYLSENVEERAKKLL